MTPEEIWRGRRDKDLFDAAGCLHDYDEEGQWTILSEMTRRGLLMPDGAAPQVPYRPQPPERIEVVESVSDFPSTGNPRIVQPPLNLWPPAQTLTRLWRGEFSLAVTYWGFAQCGGLLLAVPQLGLRAMGLQGVSLFFEGVALVYSGIVMVGIWRSASRYTGNRIWADLARAATLLPLALAALTTVSAG
jgi:hypothetical protein